MEPNPPFHSAEDALLTWVPSSAVWFRLPSGQVLLYEGHEPPGVYVTVSGNLRLSGGGQPDLLVHAPCVVPDPREVCHRSPRTVTLASDVHAVFLPRSVLLADAAIGARLEECLKRWGRSPLGPNPPEKR